MAFTVVIKQYQMIDIPSFLAFQYRLRQTRDQVSRKQSEKYLLPCIDMETEDVALNAKITVFSLLEQKNTGYQSTISG
jgi:hypothetical protein